MDADPDDVEDAPISRLASYLAQHALVTVLATGVVAIAASVILELSATDLGIVGVVSLLATLWALFLALAIYLLTAHDTDKVIEQIASLQEQLSAALAAPGADAEVVEATTSPVPEPAAATTTPGPPSSAVSARTTPTPTTGLPPTPGGADTAALAKAASHQAIIDRVPADYLRAWYRATGRTTDSIDRAWNPDPQGRGPWVVEDELGHRWSVLASQRGTPVVIPLKPHEAREAMREQRLRQSAVRRARRTDRSATPMTASATGPQPEADQPPGRDQGQRGDHEQARDQEQAGRRPRPGRRAGPGQGDDRGRRPSE